MSIFSDMSRTELRLWIATQLLAAEISHAPEDAVDVDDAIDTAELLIRRNLAYVPPTER